MAGGRFGGAARKRPESRERRTEMYTLLIVDDEPAVLEGISRILDWRALGFGRVRTARSCAEVISHMVDWKPWRTASLEIG